MNRFVPVLVLALAFAAACGDTIGGPCGGNRELRATAQLPDTGIGARGKLQLVYSEMFPEAQQVRALVVVTISPPAGGVFRHDSPSVRFLTDDGRVLMSNVATRIRGSQTWYLQQAIEQTAWRDQILAAFERGAVSVELNTFEADPRTSRVPVEAGPLITTPIGQCV
ncbi:MAG: hypothetical protein IBJ03_16040 [Gemmatimonadaceae bacterium]|nr:hypothetical protein [Gemmatimonadaceae bacterium]